MMIHGIISDGSFFDELSRNLKDDFTVITYDRRGYGASDVEPEDTDFSVAAQVEDAAQILRERTQEKAWVFGDSAGGVIAAELALRFPQLVRGLALLEPSIVFDEESKRELGEWNRELNEYVRQGRIRQAMPAFARVIGAGRDPQKNTGIKTADLAQIRMAYKNLKNFMLGELNEIQNYYPPIGEVKKITVPVCVLLTQDGRDSLFAVTSKRGAAGAGWPIGYVPGSHNAPRDESGPFAEALKGVIGKMRKGETGI